MIVINIALVILGILYGVGSVTNFKEWYYRHDYLAIALSVFTSILLLLGWCIKHFELNWFVSVFRNKKNYPLRVR